MQNFSALGAPPQDTRASGSWGLCTQTPKTPPPQLQISGYTPDHFQPQAIADKKIATLLCTLT